MELGTFGAVMAFASRLVAQSAELYETVCDRAKGPELREVLKVLQDRANRDRATMEQTRRENVTEMILEPIAGLRQEDYTATVDESVLGSDTAIVKTAQLLEARNQRFFQDSAAKLPLPEVARVFRKVAKRSEENLAKLRALTE